MRHEAGGGHAAEGYAKATGKLGVSLGTSGPGATNLVTPICDAMMDSVPVAFLNRPGAEPNCSKRQHGPNETSKPLSARPKPSRRT